MQRTMRQCLASPAPAGVLAVAVFLVAVLSPGCGGSKKTTEQPTGGDTEIEPQGEDDTLIPPEKLDAIKSFFDRKRKVVTRCFTEAVQAGELGKNAEGYVTVKMTILASGELKNVAIADASLDSARLHECLVAYVQGWTVTDLPKSLDYTYTFAFATL